MTARDRPASAVPGWWPALAGLVVGLAYAGISVYWGAGGTWLLDTVGRSLTAGGAVASAAAWAAAGLKIVAAVLPLLAVYPFNSGGSAGPARGRPAAGLAPLRRPLRFLAWAEAAILTLYGLIWTAGGLLVESGLIRADAGADRRAMAGHTFLWDPWFLVWGLLVRSRDPGRGFSRR